VICKEIGEVTDARSWEERDTEKHLHAGIVLIDAGYKKNKCRLCDRRMKNKISPEALEAFTKLEVAGTAVQIVPYHIILFLRFAADPL
jgi:twinfilin-like protein